MLEVISKYCKKILKSAFEVIFCRTVQNGIIKMRNIGGRRVFGQKWKNLPYLHLPFVSGWSLQIPGKSTKNVCHMEPVYKAETKTY